jgi:Periplasmic protein involved in polysaccharide export
MKRLGSLAILLLVIIPLFAQKMPNATALPNKNTAVNSSETQSEKKTNKKGASTEDTTLAQDETVDTSKKASGISIDSPSMRVQVALATPDYPVTPGDVYRLDFLRSEGAVTANLIVDAEYSVSLPNLGRISCKGQTFLGLRKIIETKIAEAYPYSSPQVVIASCGVFPITITGEVVETKIVYAWGLTRLSELWTGVTPYASRRDVRVYTQNGSSSKYDLFLVDRNGDLSQNPYLHPFDRVVFSRYDRQMKVQGEIKREGQYTVLPGEGLKELIEYYGDGFTVDADPTRIRIERHETGNELASAILFCDFPAQSTKYELKDQDVITIPPRIQLDHSVRKVKLQGEVHNPGEFELLPTEELAALIAHYGDGSTAEADLTRIRIDRLATGTEKANEVLFTDASVPDQVFHICDRDQVTIPKKMQTDHSIRTVSIAGQVNRPGKYTLQSSENLGTLISIYADGETDKADLSKVTITRYKSEKDKTGEYIALDYTKDKDFLLNNLDEVSVGSKDDWRPSVYFEGAIGLPKGSTGLSETGLSVSNRVNYPFRSGEKLSDAVLKLKDSFTSVSDLKNAYVIRDGEEKRIYIDLADFITNGVFTGDMQLKNNDYIIIPFRQYFVSVGGAVAIPGRYPYVPDRSWRYYVNLAGGINTDLNTGEKINITDMNDKAKEKTAVIMPEDKINVPANSFLHLLGQIATVLSVLASAATVFIYVQNLLKSTSSSGTGT